MRPCLSKQGTDKTRVLVSLICMAGPSQSRTTSKIFTRFSNSPQQIAVEEELNKFVTRVGGGLEKMREEGHISSDVTESMKRMLKDHLKDLKDIATVTFDGKDQSV